MPRNSSNTAAELRTSHAAGRMRGRGTLSIGRRLTVCFLLIVVSMIAADGVAFWQFRRTVALSHRLINADQTSLAIARVHLDGDTFRDKLATLESSHDTQQFSTEAAEIRQSFLQDVEQAQRTLSNAPEIAREDPTIPAALETLKVTLPSQLDTAVLLATAGDWTAVRLRLKTQIQGLIDLSSSLVQSVDKQVQQERFQAIEDGITAQHRLFVVAPLAGLLTLLVAIALGWYVTRTITSPLSELTAGAQALARGNFQQQVEVGGKDELAVLGSAFNYAAGQLQELYESLRDSEEQWRAAFESNPTMYFMLDGTGTILSVNAFGAEKLGYTVDELIGQPVLNIFYELDRDAIQKHAVNCFDQPGQTMKWEARKIRKDGTMIWVRETAKAVSLKNRPVLLVVCEDITEQKRAEETARRSESELREVIETIPVMAFTALPDGSQAFANRRWRQYTGLPADATAGFSWRFTIHQEDLDRHLRKWQASLASGVPFENEARHRDAHGEYRWLLVRAVPLRGETGSILKWYGVLIDIEDRKQAEALIAGEKRVLELVAKGDPLPEVLDTLCGLVEEQAKGALASILLVEGNKLKHGSAPNLPKAYTDVIDGGLVGPFAGSCGTAACRGEQVVVEDIATDPLWANYRDAALTHSLQACWSTPVFSSQGNVIATFAMYYREPRRPTRREQEVIEQITHLAGVAIERKLTYDQLRRSEAYLAEAQKLTHTGSWAFQAGGSPLYWSEENFRIWGFDPQEEAPELEQVQARIHPEDRERAVEDAKRAVRMRTDFAQEFRIVLPDGTVRSIHAVGHPVVNASGEGIEVVGTHVDITERKRAEQERERLRQVEADLVHISRVSMMGELAVSLAHEIKQPIAAAAANADTCFRWLRREPPDIVEARETARMIVEDVNRAADIIDRVRSLYRRSKPNHELVDLNELIREMVLLLRDKANLNSVSIRTQPDALLPKVGADRVQVQQVLMNLMLNGLEAMKDAGGELNIRSMTDSDQILVTVSDSGVGLPAEDPEQIFEAFFTTKSEGTGMGLSISRRIIESYGGRLWATSNGEKGATFHFTLPQAAHDSSAADES